MKAYLLTGALLLAATPVFACTAEEAASKGTEVSQKIQELAVNDPQKATEIAQRMASTQAQAATDLVSACKILDDMLEELK